MERVGGFFVEAETFTDGHVPVVEGERVDGG